MRVTRFSVLRFLLFALTLVCLPVLGLAEPTLAGRAVWSDPRDAGTTAASVRAFVDRLAKAHVNTLVMEVKTSGGVFWPSQRFPEAVVPD